MLPGKVAARDEGLHRKLSGALLSGPTGLLAGAACGMAAGGVALLSATAPAVGMAGALLASVALLRAITALTQHSPLACFGSLLNRHYWLGALFYATATGAAAGLSIFAGEDADLQMLLVGFALIFGAGIAAGNARYPKVAFAQMALIFLPIVAGFLSSGSLALTVLALIVPLLSVTLVLVTRQVHSSLSEQARHASESADIAALLHRHARIDDVTGLCNRTGFETTAAEVLAGATSPGEIALFWINLRRFKEVNENLGHHTGDRVLAETAARIRRRMGGKGVAARFGSDEFLVLAEMPSRRDAEYMAGLLCSDLAQPMRLVGHRIETGASVGVCMMDETSPDLDRMMEHADLALYHARTAGRNEVSFYDPCMTRNLARRKEIEAELREAILRDELSIYFQPIVDLKTGRIRAFEALVRWFHPERGELVPEEFIPVAEETGLIITLGNWVTRRAARTAATWPDEVKLAINLSPAQIQAGGAALGILGALKEARLDPARLELEVTENLFLDDADATARFMEMLAAQGVCFALDDFGTGYSSLHYINKYPFRTIKVDRSFVSGAHSGLRSDAIIRAVAEMGATLGMEIVAEGLETAEQVHNVRRAGCTLGQGYHFSRAVPEHLAARLLDDERAEETSAPRRAV